jgi:hypothetical protein
VTWKKDSVGGLWSRSSASFAIVGLGVELNLVKPQKPRPRTYDLDEVELRASQQLVGIIDILLGLTLVEGALAFRGMFTQGSNANVPAVVAMVLVYYTAVRSFVEWHVAMETYRYRVLTDGCRTSELRRVFLDFVIMASYSFLILRSHVLIEKPDSDLTAIAIAYPAIYFAYIVWGELLKEAYAGRGYSQQFRPRLILLMCFLSSLLCVAYVVGRHHEWLGADLKDLNTAFLVAELALMLWFRHKSWSQQIILKDEAPLQRTSSG